MNNRLSPFYKNIALWLLITLVMILLYHNFYTRGTHPGQSLHQLQQICGPGEGR